MNDIKQRLAKIKSQIRHAEIAVGRDKNSVRLLAVSKTKPATDIAIAYQAGQRNFGESYLQEALKKQQELAAFDISWHFIGPIQSNKTKLIAAHFSWVHSVDRLKIAKRLSEQRPLHLPALNICLQVNIDREPQKAGASPEEILQLATHCDGLDNIKLRGLMALPRMSSDPATQHDSFRRVRILFEELKNAGHDIDTLSMGMSSDLEIAVSEGSTMVRIGTDLLGKRET